MAERWWPFSSSVEQSVVRAMGSFLAVLLRDMRMSFSMAWRSLFIAIFLPPHLFDYIFSLEILSFLSPFTPSVDTNPCVCLSKIQLAHAGGECIYISQNC